MSKEKGIKHAGQVGKKEKFGGGKGKRAIATEMPGSSEVG